MATHSGLLSGLGTLAVLFVRFMDTHSALVRFMATCSALLSSLWARVLFCQAYGHLQSHLSGLWTLTVLVRFMGTHSALLSGLWTLTVLFCQAYGHSQCLFVRLVDICSASL